jgi:hypothetical protein
MHDGTPAEFNIESKGQRRASLQFVKRGQSISWHLRGNQTDQNAFPLSAYRTNIVTIIEDFLADQADEFDSSATNTKKP